MLNVTLVERPIRFVTLRSVVEAALRHRRHQYQIRDTLLQLTRARHELELANQDLELRVHERTQKLQETVNELEAFSYSVSHDLRAPLRSIEGYGSVLSEDYGDKLDARGKVFLAKITAAAARLDRKWLKPILNFANAVRSSLRSLCRSFARIPLTSRSASQIF